jgi:guanine deaminase
VTPVPATVFRSRLFDTVPGPRGPALRIETDGALAVRPDGTIGFRGTWSDLPAEYHAAIVLDHRDGFVLPGFIDTHVHFPQVFSTGAYGGGRLLTWLERCIFPAEARLADPAFAEVAAAAFCARRAAVGTTTALVFGSAFPEAQKALYTQSLAWGLRTVSGRGVQTLGPTAAAPLLTDIDTAIGLCRDEIDEWHGAGDGLVRTAVVPRFALSLAPADMRRLAEFYDEVRGAGVYFHTHLAENDSGPDGEVASVRREYGTSDYLAAYAGFLGRRAVFAHAVHCDDDELSALAGAGSSIAHCPVSQLFLGSGTTPWRRTIDAGVTVALGTDVGAGDEWLLPRVANAAYKVHLSDSDSVALDAATLLDLCTLAGARALDLDDRIGNLQPGKEADFVVIDPDRAPALRSTLDHCSADAEATIYTLLMTMREDAVAATYVRGRPVHPPVV